LHRQIPRALTWIADDIVTGTTARIIRASWRFWLHVATLQLGLLIWLSLAIAAGWLIAHLAATYLAAPFVIAFAVGIIAAILAVFALRPLADRWLIVRLNNGWPYMRDYNRGRPTCFDRLIEVGAQRLKAAVDTADADEIVVIGHSGGGLFAL